MSLAPVLVSVYNRKKHFINCINRLKENNLAKDTVLYVVSDNYYKLEHKAIISEIREYVLNLSGFKEVRCIFNNENLGSHKSVRNAFDVVLKENNSIIFLEDDIEVSKFFLKYMNDGLDMFQKNKKIFSICGYNPNSLKIPKNYDKDIYLWSRNSPWGFATWKDRWYDLDLELTDYEEFIKDKKRVREFKRIAPMSMSVLQSDRRGEIQATDVRISFNMFIRDMYSVFPVKSLVRNNGFDGSGEHCGTSNEFNDQIYQKEIKLLSDIRPDKGIYRARRKWHTSFIRDYISPKIRSFPFVYNKLKYVKNILMKQNIN